MFGGPAQPPSLEEMKLHQQITNQTIQTAAAIATVLWLIPTLIHFLKKLF